ncbi:MAG: T9SS type A sorting domain-containing protein, partial [Pseudomonadota bacterium]
GYTNVVVSPVPNNGNLTLTFYNPFDNENGYIEIRDSRNKLVYQQNENFIKGNNIFNLSIFNAENGLYTIRIIGKHNYATKEIMVVK